MVAACLAGCSSDNEAQNPGTQTPETPRPMYVDIIDTPEGGDAAAPLFVNHRAGAPITTATLSSFSMNYQGNKYDFTKTGEVWSTNAWPTGVPNDQKIDFYAYTSGTFNYNGGNPYVAFTVEEAASSQHDLLVAEHKQISYNDASGHVSLCFDHACAAVRFSVQITNTLRTQLGGDLSVTSIILRNVIKDGSYYYNTKSWTLGSTSTYFTLNNAPITVTNTPQQLSSNYLYMIPQTRAANGTTGTYLEINYTSGTAKTATIPLGINWEAGKSYPINIKLGTTTIK